MNKSFSDRMGLIPQKPFLMDSISDPLRNALWNVISITILEWDDYWENRLKNIYAKGLGWLIDEMPDNLRMTRREIKKHFFFSEDTTWIDIYDFIQFIVENEKYVSRVRRLDAYFNVALAEHYSGYRFVQKKLLPITSESEVNAIQTAATRKSGDKFAGARKHINTAIELLSNRPEPHYRNTIKESISTVESVVKIISGEDSGGLSGALNVLGENIPIHGALKQGFLNLYGYTSDEDGIRHSILEERDIGFDEAKYMLVSCSGFINYLISKADKINLA